MFEIGASLREARSRQGLDFPELELRTKVRAKYLRLLEEEQFEQLPAHTYIKGFLRTYADALGLDGQLYVDEYNSRFVPGDDDSPVRARRSATPMPRARSRRRERRESRVVGLALIAILVVTALVIAAWRFGGPGNPSVHGLTKTPRSTTTVRRAAVTGVVIKATRGASFLEVRRSTSAGRPLFSGTLAKGDRQIFSARRLWISIASPRNVVVTVYGKRFTIPTGGEFELTART
jgi:cytoskeleton protein RodZ